MKAENKSDFKKTSLSAIAVMTCTLISRILGFIRIAVVGAFFGATGEADVLNSVFSIPNNLRKLMAEGALSSAFIPVLTSSLVNEKNNDTTKRIIRNILTFQFIILVPVCLLSIIFADFLINTILLEFKDPYLNELAVVLFRWFISYILLISISAALMAVLNTTGYFLIPSVTPILFSISVIISIFFLYETLGIFSMAAGVLAGGLLQIFFQMPVFLKLGYDFKPDFNFRNSYFIRIMKNWLPVGATASIFTINQQIAIRFASGLETGSSSALSYALVFWQLPFGIFSASITTVLFPKLSKFAATGDSVNLLKTMNSGMVNLFSLLLPSSIFMFIMGPEIVSIAMQRGFFTAENTQLTSNVLKGYSLGLFSIGIFNFLQRFYYSIHEYKKPFIFAVIVCIIDVSLSLWLKETRLRVTGLAIANTIAFSAGMFFMTADIKKRNRDLDLKYLNSNVSRIVLSLSAPAILLSVSRIYFGRLWINGLSVNLLLYFTLSAVVFTLSVILIYKILNIDFIFFRKKTV